MKKYIGVGFVALGLLFLVSFAAPAQAAGLTETQITAVVNLVASFGADAATVKNVEASLRGQATTGSSNTGTANNSACPTLYKALTLGSQDSHGSTEVADLQRFLRISPTGYFGRMTSDALQKWQAAQGIAVTTKGAGVVGPKTRATMMMKCNRAPVISSFTGPTGLEVNQTGTWKVEVTDPENDSLKYVVRWDDEPSPQDVAYPFNWPALGFATAYTSPTFTHSYSKAGTYVVRVAVTDIGQDVNHTTDRTLTVVVR